MTTNIGIVTEVLKYEAQNYKEQHDAIKATRERELREVRENYQPGSKLAIERERQINEACDSSLTKLKVSAVDRALQDVEELRQQELFRVQTVNEPLLAKVRAIADVPMTTLELKAFAAKIGAKGDYWASRMLADIAEKNGIDSTEIGIESTYDTKMSILDQLTDQLNSIFKHYGTNDPTERPKVNYLYLSDEICERAKQMYGGKIGRLSDTQKADKAYLTIMTQHTDIQKGIAISNVLRNAKGDVKNLILCRLAEDRNISEMAAEFSGHMNEISEFKNGKAAEYRLAEKALQNIRKVKDRAAIENIATEYSDNEFFGEMFKKEKKQNFALAEILSGELVQDPDGETE